MRHRSRAVAWSSARFLCAEAAGLRGGQKPLVVSDEGVEVLAERLRGGHVDGVQCAQPVLAEAGGALQRGLVDGDQRHAGEDGGNPSGGWGGGAPGGGEVDFDEGERAGDAVWSVAQGTAQGRALAFLDDELDDG